MQLQNVSFETWLGSHGHKEPQERWLRELYPWPVFAQIDCDNARVGQKQRILQDDVEYQVTLESVEWQPRHNTFRYRVFVESEGLGWHARSFEDRFDLCGAPNGAFVTLFHRDKKEPLEKIARAFFARRWADLSAHSFRSLAVSRFLAASIVAMVVEDAFPEKTLAHYPRARLVSSASPTFAQGEDLWLGYRFFSEDAYAWARRCAGVATKVISLYFADTKYQFCSDLPENTSVQSVSHLDASRLGGKYEDFILALQRGLDLPGTALSSEQLESTVLNGAGESAIPSGEADVHEALAALARPCDTKAELRYQLAAAVVLNAWIEAERDLGYSKRKRFYAFKQRVDALARWAIDAKPSGVTVWADAGARANEPVLYFRIDEVDFSFHAIPFARDLLGSSRVRLEWKGVRLKPMAPVVLAWARGLRQTAGVGTAPKV